MAWHHIVPKHEWKARFGNLQGFNDQSNLVNLTTEQHGAVHLHYFNEITHNDFDLIAGRGILGQIGKEELTKQAIRVAHLGKKRSPETCARIGASKLGKKHSRETRLKMKISHIGLTLSLDTKRKISQGKLGNTAWLGKKHKQETKEKQKASALRRWDELKGRS